MLLVLDASVAVKWFLPPELEDLVREAFDLLRRHEAGKIQFVVPDVFWVEFASVAWKAVRRKRWHPSDAASALDDLIRYRFPTVASGRLVKRALAIASANHSAVYDSVYIALAEEMQCDVITADQRLVHGLGARFPVRWLGSFSIS